MPISRILASVATTQTRFLAAARRDGASWAHFGVTRPRHTPGMPSGSRLDLRPTHHRRMRESKSDRLLVPPHGGGALRPLMAMGDELAAERARAQTLRAVRVSSREKGDLIMLAIGGFTPLDGFMTRAGLGGSLRPLPDGGGPLLADSDHAVGRCRNGGNHRRRGGHRPHRSGRRHCPGGNEGHRAIPYRQGARMRVGLQDHGSRAPGRE